MPVFRLVMLVSVVLQPTITLNMASLPTVIIPAVETGTSCVEDTMLIWCIVHANMMYILNFVLHKVRMCQPFLVFLF